MHHLRIKRFSWDDTRVVCLLDITTYNYRLSDFITTLITVTGVDPGTKSLLTEV